MKWLKRRQLKRQLGSSDTELRHTAIVELEKLGSRSVVEAIMGLLHDPEKTIRERAAQALGNLRDARAVQPLIAALDDSDASICVQAQTALGKIGDPLAAEPLLACLEDWAAGFEAAKARGLLLPYGGVSWDLPREAGKALVALGHVPASNRERALLCVASEDWDGAVALGTEAVPPLIRALEDPTSAPAAARALRRLGEVAVEPLRAKLREDAEDRRLTTVKRRTARRRWLAAALGRNADVRDQQALMALLADDSRELRRAVAEALEGASLPGLEQTLADSRRRDELEDLEAARRARRAREEPWEKVFRARREEQAVQVPATRLTQGVFLDRQADHESRAGRAGKCRTCGKVWSLTEAKEETLDWDGVYAYKYYCPRCFKGTHGTHYYTGQLEGSDGKAVIDQWGWIWRQ